MTIKPTYVFSNLPYLSHYICEFLPHPFSECRRRYQCSVAKHVHGILVEQIHEMRGVERRGAFSINGMKHCICSIEHFLLSSNSISFGRLLLLCRYYKCEWFCRSIEKMKFLKMDLDLVQKKHKFRTDRAGRS